MTLSAGRLTLSARTLVELSANVTGGLAPLPVNFTDSALSRTSPLEWSWNFGDGAPVQKGQNNIDGNYSGSVEHTYNSAGEYTVTLTFSNGQGAANKTSRVFVAKPIVSSLSIGKYVVSLDENTKEIVINPGYGNVEVINNAVLIQLKGVDLYIYSENGFATDQNGYLKGTYQYAALDKTPESVDLGNGLTAGFSFSANFNGQLSALLSPDAGITCGVVPGTPSSSIEQAFNNSFAASSLYMNKAAYSLIIEKNGLNGINISDASISMTAPSDYVNAEGGSDKFTIMSWLNGGVEKLTTTSSTDNSSSEFTGFSSTGFSSDGSFVASLLSLTSTANDGSGDGSGSGGSSSGEDSSGGGGGDSPSGGGSSGGGGGVSPEALDNIEIKELSQQFVVSGTHIKFGFSKGATSVGSIEFDARKSFGKVSTFVEMLIRKSSLVTSLPAGTFYKNFNIWVGSGGVITSKTIDNASIDFKVEKVWVQNNNIDLSTITLNRYSGGSWNALPTTLVKEEGAFYYFKAKTPGFSPFSITGSGVKPLTTEVVPFREVPKTVVQADRPVNEVPQIAGQVLKNETDSSGSGVSPIILVVSAILIVLCASSLAIPQVRNKVRDQVESKVRDILYGDLESSDSEVDKVKELSETESEVVAGQESTILVT